MKCLRSFFTLAVLAFALPSSAAVYTTPVYSSFHIGNSIPDANPAGWRDTRTFDVGPGLTITDVNVTFSVSGGYNGDLYGYLSYTPSTGGEGGFVILLNRVGSTQTRPFGSDSSGFDVTLDDAGPNGNIHEYAGVLSLSGSYQPDGRFVDPLLAHTSSGPTTSLASFNGLPASGSWTLFFADLSGGGISTVQNWSLEIQAVPEPVNAALVVVGVGALGIAGVRNCRRKRDVAQK